VARNSKAKSKSFRKKVEKRIIFLESFFYTLAAYFCTKGFTTCIKGENYVFKVAVSSIFSIIVKSQKTYFYLWKPKNDGPVVLKWVFQYMETIISMSG